MSQTKSSTTIYRGLEAFSLRDFRVAAENLAGAVALAALFVLVANLI